MKPKTIEDQSAKITMIRNRCHPTNRSLTLIGFDTSRTKAKQGQPFPRPGFDKLFNSRLENFNPFIRNIQSELQKEKEDSLWGSSAIDYS
jgi:hypothetical protein